MSPLHRDHVGKMIAVVQLSSMHFPKEVLRHLSKDKDGENHPHIQI